MKRSFLLTVAISILLIMTGCTTDPYYPNLLNGKVKQDTYTAHVGKANQTFTVTVPQTYNNHETMFLTANEVYRGNYTYLSLGPIPTDDTVYRLLVVDKGNQSLRAFQQAYLALFLNMGIKDVARQMDKVYQTTAWVNGHPAIYTVYNQIKRNVYLYYDDKQTNNMLITHGIYSIDYGRYGVMIWVQASSDSGINEINNTNQKAFRLTRWLPMYQFVRSFHFNKRFN